MSFDHDGPEGTIRKRKLNGVDEPVIKPMNSELNQTVYNGYFSDNHCQHRMVYEPYKDNACSIVKAFSFHEGNVDLYAVFYCFENVDDSPWRMSLYSSVNCESGTLIMNVYGNTGAECVVFPYNGAGYSTQVLCLHNPDKDPTAVPTSAPSKSYASNYDGQLTLYNGTDPACSPDQEIDYISLPMQNFSCVPSYINDNPVNLQLYTTSSGHQLGLHDPADPTCSNDSLINTIQDMGQDTCGTGFYNYDNTVSPFSVRVYVGVPKERCETLYNGVLPQSYTLLFFNVFLFFLLKFLSEEYILPPLIKWVSPYLPHRCRYDQVNRSAESQAITVQILFLWFQAISAVVALVYAFLLRDEHETGWHQYQNFYGFLLNSPYLTFFISHTILTGQLISHPDSNNNPSAAVFSCACFNFIILLPPFITHFIPGVVVYCWVLIMFYVAVVVLVLLILGWGRVIGIDMRDGEDSGITSNPNFNGFFLQVIGRVVVIFCFQTFFTYMVLFYQQSAHASNLGRAISAEDYLGVVSHEYNLRSQTWCNFEHALENAKNGLVFFSWL